MEGLMWSVGSLGLMIIGGSLFGVGLNMAFQLIRKFL